MYYYYYYHISKKTDNNNNNKFIGLKKNYDNIYCYSNINVVNYILNILFCPVS